MAGINLDESIHRGRTTKADLARILSDGYSSVSRSEASTESGSVEDYYVDRPSPLFMAPGYVIVEFESGERIRSVSYAAPFGGCA